MMKLRCLTVLSLAAVGLLASSAQAQEWGDLKVKFVYDGSTVPKQEPLKITADQAVCEKHAPKDESLIVNPSNKGIKNVIVYLVDEPSAVHPDYAASATSTVEVDNKGCRFAPHIQLVRVGQTLKVLNSDPVGHNTFIFTLNPANPQQNPVISSGGSFTYKFNAEERIPVKLSCNIHPWMYARVVVCKHPYMAKSDENGELVIKNLPAGSKLEFQLYHENKYLRKVEVGGEKVDRKGRFEVTIKPGMNDLGEVKCAADLFTK